MKIKQTLVLFISVMSAWQIAGFQPESGSLPSGAARHDLCPLIFSENSERAREVQTVLRTIVKSAKKLQGQRLNGEIVQSLLEAAFGEEIPGVDATTNLVCLMGHVDEVSQTAGRGRQTEIW